MHVSSICSATPALRRGADAAMAGRLPAETRHMLTKLMVRLIFGHADRDPRSGTGGEAS